MFYRCLLCLTLVFFTFSAARSADHTGRLDGLRRGGDLGQALAVLANRLRDTALSQEERRVLERELSRVYAEAGRPALAIQNFNRIMRKEFSGASQRLSGRCLVYSDYVSVRRDAVDRNSGDPIPGRGPGRVCQRY